MTQQLSVAETTIDNSIVNIQPDYSKAISQNSYSLIPEDQLLAAKRQVMKSAFAMTCVKNSPLHFQDAVRTAGVLGLDLTDGKKQGWLIPRQIKVVDTQGKERKMFVIVLQTGYKGAEAIHQRLGVIDRLFLRVVRANDEFSWSGDDTEKPAHNANWFAPESERGEIIGAYCITYFPNKSIMVSSAGIEEIYTKHRDVSDSWKNEQKRQWSPWTTFPEQMILKTIQYIASKQWPAYKMSKDGHASKVIEALHKADTDDYQELKQIPQDARFEGFLMTNDAIGMFLLEKEYLNGQPNFDFDDENGKAWVNLFSNFPKGFIGRIKKQVQDLIDDGQNQVLNLIASIEAEDPATIELIEHLSAGTMKMLEKELGDVDTQKLHELIK